MTPAPPIYRTITVNGIILNYLERPADGSSTNAPLLLLHGLLATAETQLELIAGLPGDRRIVAIDLLSTHTLDPMQPFDHHFAFLTAIVHSTIEQLGLDRPIFIGHSHGGVLALSLATTHRELLSGLVLLAPAHPFGGYRSHVVDFYLRQPGRFLALCIPVAPSWMILRAYNQAAGPGKPIRMRHLRPYLRILRHRNTLRRILEMLVTWDDDMAELQRSLAEANIALPTLLLWGDADVVVPLSSAPGLEGHLDRWEQITLPGIGHLIAEEAPVQTAALIRDWLIHQENALLARH